MPFIEASTTFYLGRRYDPTTKRLTEDVVYYDSRDLTTHAVVMGMTGSGKTGLCITLLEEAILDNLPAIIIDPKGDITNLLLNFPDLRPEDFEPWVNVDDARRAGLDVPAFAADVAQRWRDGLAGWGIVPDRMRWLKLATKYSIFTPGSDAGLPISILASLRAPREGWVGNEEANREKINGIVTALLALIGKNVEPLKDREHVLIANIFEYAWVRGQNLTLEDIILQVQKPPFDKLGVFPIDEYMPEKARFKLAMEMNSIIAAPSFQSWIQGEPMDIQNLLYQPNGRPRVSIFYIAHLSEAERQFIITLLLENMLGWMRTLSGTTSLRALLYIDEMFGYFPPYPRNPPTKEPILRLLKQARAFGLGLILATQNPGDLDYKGLSNAGTWFIGRLTSENDKQKVMSGLQSLASADNDLNLGDVQRLIADIEPRVFLMQNVHDDGGPIMVHTRWAMSYLRGPLTRQQVQVLMAPQRQQLMAQAAPVPPQSTGAMLAQTAGMTVPPPSLPGGQTGAMRPASLPPALPESQGFNAQQAASPASSMPLGYTQPTVPVSQANLAPAGGSQATVPGLRAPQGFSPNQPPLPAATPQYFLPNTVTIQQAITQYEQQTRIPAQGFGGGILAYRPVLFAQATVRYQDRKASLYTARNFAFHVPNVDKAGIVHWEQYQTQPVEVSRISGQPFGQAIFGDLSPGLTDSRRMAQLKKELVDVLYNIAALKLPFNPTLGIYANPDTNYNEFRAQVQQIAREQRDAEVDKLTAKYEAVLDKLDDQLKREARDLSANKKELADLKREELFTTGEAVLSLLKGRTTYTLSRATRATRYRNQAGEQIEENEQKLAMIQQEMSETEQEFEAQLKATNDKWARIAAEEQEYLITPYKKDILVDLFGIGWIPYWYVELNGQPTLLNAFQ
jgi:hypothetical protein